jgi:methionine synthase II (cobalamin-independent)
LLEPGESASENLSHDGSAAHGEGAVRARRLEGIRPDRGLGAGVVDVKGFYPEIAQDVAGRIRRVLAVCRPEKLYVNPDCGFGWSPRYMCNQKIRALAAGAALARAELTGAR